jgi:uncharacterized membrane protein
MKETLLNFLHGKWLNHPLHAAVVHVPVGLWPAAFLFDLLSRWGIGGNPIVKLSFYAISLGLLSLVLAVPSGIADWGKIKKEKPAWRLALYHMALNLVVALLFAVNFGLRVHDFRSATTVETAPLLLTAIGVLLLIPAAYLGGRMVYDHGIGVARFSKRKLRARAETQGSNVPSS